MNAPLRAGAPPPAIEKPPAAANHGGLFEVNTGRSNGADNADARSSCKESSMRIGPDAREPDYGDFNWHDEDAPVVIQGQPRTVVYINPVGQLVIRQERDPLTEEDSFVYFNPESCGGVVRGLSLMLLKIGEQVLTLRTVRGLIGQFQRIERAMLEAAK